MHALSKVALPVFGLSIVLASCTIRNCEAYGGEDKIFQYGPKSAYSRAVAAKGNKIFIGNSDGYIYRLNTRNGKSKVITKNALPELRDIEVTGCRKLVAMQSADTSSMIVISGKKETVFKVSKHPVFLDGMDILPSGKGFMMGDPVKGDFSLYKTADHGKSWQEIEPKLHAGKGEAGFAASGTNVQCINDSTFIFVSGGMQSHFFKTTNSGKNWSITLLPFERSEGSGAFSMHFMDERQGVAVGGDYAQPAKSQNTCFYTRDGGMTWTASQIPPRGYRSCVTEWKGDLFACGTNGIDRSEDGGVTWGRYKDGNYIAFVIAKGKLYVTMPEGRILEM